MKRLVISFISIFSIVFASQAATFTVTSTGDNTGAGVGTLRQAIADANAAGGTGHTILFTIPAGSIININSDLQIAAGSLVGLTINGFIDAVAGPDVIIRSSGALNNKLFLNGASGVKIYGLVFDNLEYGVQMTNSTTCEVKGCYFGTNLAGSLAGTGIQHSGVFITGGGSANIIGGIGTIAGGGTTNSERNLFVKCMQVNTGTDQVRYGAVLIEGSSSNQIVNNYFGVDITGATKLGNGTQAPKMPLDHHNILIRNGNTANTVIDRNLIAGVTGCGIYIENGPTGAVVKGNIIGLNAATTAKFPNEACGIFMESTTAAIIGGSTAVERNIISGNGGAAHNNYDDVCHFGWNDFNQYGIYAKNINGCTFKGNYIGTDATGNSAGASNILGNRAGGIKIVSQEDGGGSANNIVGGSSIAGEGNVISGNGYNIGASSLNALCGAATASGIAGGPGITLQYGTCQNNTILGNSIGLGADGVTALGNSQEGISILGAANNKIGGSTPAEANFITNNLWGVMLQIDFACHYVGTPVNDCNNTLTKVSSGNIIVGNSIGIDKSGAAKGNGNRTGDNEGGGICLQMGSSGNYIGRNNAGEGNVIAGNRVGIVFRDGDVGKYAKGAAKNNFVYNNIIGDPTGGTSGNTLSPAQTIYGHGILMQVGDVGTTFPSGNTIGGTGANMRNFISGNQQSGILLHNPTAITVTTANSIVGNFIGTTVTGLADAGNIKNGIEIVNVSKTTISSNLISGNDINGISLTGSSTNTIQNNTIGSNSTKTAPIPNTSNGISLAAGSANNIIGGVAANEPNFIFNNGANGVVVDGAASINNSIHKNSFSCNTLRGIVLSPAALGGNNNYAAPTIAGTPTQLTLTGPAGSIIEVFETDGCATCATGTSTRLQGKTWIASSTTNVFVFDVAAGFDKTKKYTALAHAGSTTAAHNTSEFSACYTVCTDPSSVAITAGGPVTFCAGGSVTLTAVVTGGAGTVTYQWKNGTTTLTGETNSTYVATTSGSYTVVYNSDQACTANITSAATTVTVNPRPTVTSANTAIVCSGTALNYTITSSVASSYSWTRNAVAGVSNATVTSTANPIAETLLNTTTAPVNVVYTITPTSTTGSCAGTAFTLTVTVNPKPAINSSNTATVCSDSPFSYPITSNVSSTYSWTRAAVTGISNAAGSGTGSPISETLTNNTTSPINVVYTITPTATTTLCAGNAFTLTVTVNPKPTVTSLNTGAVCSGKVFNYTVTSSVGSSVAWTRPAVTGITNAAGSGSTSAISETLINSTTSPIDVIYSIIPTATTGSCIGNAFTLTVTVTPSPSITSPSTASVCSNSPFNYTITSSLPSSYGWNRPAVAGISNPAGLGIIGASGILSETLENTTTSPINVVYSIVPTSTSGSCAGNTFTLTVTVNPKPVITSANTGNVCSGSPFSYVITSGAASTYAWSRASVSGITPATGSGTSSPISETLTSASPSSVVVDYLITPTSTSGSCAGDAFTLKVTINPKPTISSSNTANVCSGAPFSYAITSGTAATYAWTRAAVTDVTPATGSGTSSPISETLTSASATAVSVVYLITPTATTSLCAGDAFTLTVTVNPKPVITSANKANVCSGSPFNYEITSNNASSYTWTRASVTGVSPSTGSGSSSPITETLTNTSLSSVNVVYTITPTSTSGSCAGNAFALTVTVDPKPVVTITANGTTTFCTGGSVELTASAAGFSGGSFEWFHDGTPIVPPTNPVTVSLGGSYTAVYTSTSSCISDNSNTIAVTITPDVSTAVAQLDSVTTCLYEILLVAKKPAVGTGVWTIYSPNPATPTSLVSIPNRSVDSMQAIDLVNGVSYKFLYKITSTCGVSTDTVFVKVGIDNFDLIASAPTDTLCVKTQRNLTAQVIGNGGSGNYNYIWVGSDGTTYTTTNPVLGVSPTGETTDYTVHVQDMTQIGCITNDASVTLHAVNGQDLNIPNLITPNGDNKNDIFYLADKNNGLPMIKEGSHLNIYNRWGNRVYEANNYDNTWEAKELSDGVYYYHITSSCGNKEYKSWLQILGNKNN